MSSFKSYGLTVASLLLMSGIASAAEGAFSSLAGSWSGGGTINMSNGASERLRCKVNYVVGEGGVSAKQDLRCASDSYRVDVQSNVALSGSQNVVGTWTETSRGVSGNVSGRANSGQIDATIAGPGFGAGLAIGTRKDSQTITIKVNGGDVQSVSLNLKRN